MNCIRCGDEMVDDAFTPFWRCDLCGAMYFIPLKTWYDEKGNRMEMNL